MVQEIDDDVLSGHDTDLGSNKSVNNQDQQRVPQPVVYNYKNYSAGKFTTISEEETPIASQS